VDYFVYNNIYALIERYEIKKAFSFDRHFKALGIPVLGEEQET